MKGHAKGSPRGSWPNQRLKCARLVSVSQLWHVKCVSEGRSSTYLPGHGLARCSPVSERGLSFLLRSHRRLSSQGCRKTLHLSDVREPTLTVVCEPRGRRGRYNLERLTGTRRSFTCWLSSPTAPRCSRPISMIAARRSSTPSTTRSAARTFWRRPMLSAAPTRARRAWTVRTSRPSRRMGWSDGWANWRLRSGRRLTDRTLSDAFSYLRPAANSGRWASQPCGIGSA